MRRAQQPDARESLCLCERPAGVHVLLPTFGSSPRIRRAMLARCSQITKSAISASLRFMSVTSDVGLISLADESVDPMSTTPQRAASRRARDLNS